MAEKRKADEGEATEKKAKTKVDRKEIKSKMEYKYLGKSGLRVSALSFGAWVTWGLQVDDDTAYETMKAAWDMGCNFFDNAETYASGKAEEVMGRCIKRLMKEEKVEREDLVISTKIFWGGTGVNRRGLSRKHIIEGLNASLKRLDLDYVDLVFAHRPDPDTPIEETVRAFNHVINQGKAFYWGTSEWTAEQITEAAGIASRLGLIAPLMEQPQYSLLHRTRVEVEYARLYKDIGLGTTIWSPLASGLLTGKYSKGVFPEGSRLTVDSYKWLKEQFTSGQGLNGLEVKDVDAIFEKVAALQAVADGIGITLPQLALGWCLTNSNVSTVITGASKAWQVEENFSSLLHLSKFTPKVLEEIEAAAKTKPTPVRKFR